MKLFLASEAKHPESMKKLHEFVGGLQGKKILYIPTAANGEGWQSWRDSRTLELLNILKLDIQIVELEHITDEKLVLRTEDIDIIWMAGGMPGYLLYWIRRRKLDQLLPKLLEKGIVYVGSSAGSMICGKNLSVMEWYPDDLEIGASFIPGLGLIDFDIFPHYAESMLPIIQQHWKNGELYLLKNGEAITVQDNKIEVYGSVRTLEI